MDELNLVCDICGAEIEPQDVYYDEDRPHTIICLWCDENIEHNSK